MTPGCRNLPICVFIFVGSGRSPWLTRQQTTVGLGEHLSSLVNPSESDGHTACHVPGRVRVDLRVCSVMESQKIVTSVTLESWNEVLVLLCLIPGPEADGYRTNPRPPSLHLREPSPYVTSILSCKSRD